MPKLYKVEVKYYICADSKEEAETAVIMASSQIYESMKSWYVAHTTNVKDSDIFHAHELPQFSS